MRSLIFITFLAILLTSMIRSHESQLYHKNEHAASDTDFILREITKDDYHAVFIEKNRKSKYYKRLSDFKMDKWDLEEYNQNYSDVKKHFLQPLKRFDLNGLLKEWIPLYRYKGRYYVYYPSDAGALARRIITDSTVIYWFMDGPLPQPILSAKKTDKKDWYLNFSSGFHGRKGSRLTIHLIDSVNQIYVWEDLYETELQYRYMLYIPKEKVKNFDVIVNYSINDRQAEFDFDDIDYKALLKRNNKK